MAAFCSARCCWLLLLLLSMGKATSSKESGVCDAQTCTQDATLSDLGLTDALEQAENVATAQALLQKQTVLAPKVSKPHKAGDAESEGAAHSVSLSDTQATVTDAQAIQAHSVSLNEAGYRKIAKLKSESEMEHFVKRAVDELGYKINSEGHLKGVVPYYSGKKAVQSYTALKDELSRVSKKKSGWATKRGDAIATSAKRAEGEDDEEEEKKDSAEEEVLKKKITHEDATEARDA